MAKIMIVDDDPSLREVIKRVLKAEGYDVLESENGIDCLESLKNGERPDLIFLDVMMPKKDGWEVCSEIKSNDELKDIPICMLTVKSGPWDSLRSFSVKANWHIHKPASKKIIIDTARWLLSSKDGETPKEPPQ